MALVETTAVVLRRHQLGETSRVVVCYTRDHGKVRLVAKGVRKGGGRLGAALEPFVVSGVAFYLHPSRALSLASWAEIEAEFPALRTDVVRQAYASAALELTETLVADRAPDPELFDLLVQTLREMETAPRHDLDAFLWRFELLLADALGYAPELSNCVVCGRKAADGARFSPELGGVVCGACPGADAARSDEVARILRDLKGGAPVSDHRGLTEVEREDVGKALLEHLGHHAGRELRLRSLSVLASLERTSRITRRPIRSDEKGI
jgi:DNA repair protein RecO (recombination protein O)